MGPVDTMDVLTVLESFYDLVPRAKARVEDFGSVVLFVREGPGWPYYARPAPGGDVVRPEDLARALHRQEELDVPRAVEWIHDLVPTLGPIVEAAGLPVALCPLLVLDGLPAPSNGAGGTAVSGVVGSGGDVRLGLVAPDDADLAAVDAVAALAFGAPPGSPAATMSRGGATAERDRRAAEVTPDARAQARAAVAEGLASGRLVRVVARADDGPVAVGAFQRVGAIAEIVGVATLPGARRNGLAGRVTAALAAEAMRSGASTVFLSAQDEDVARVYERVGFRRVGTAGIAEDH